MSPGINRGTAVYLRGIFGIFIRQGFGEFKATDGMSLLGDVWGINCRGWARGKVGFVEIGHVVFLWCITGYIAYTRWNMEMGVSKCLWGLNI